MDSKPAKTNSLLDTTSCILFDMHLGFLLHGLELVLVLGELLNLLLHLCHYLAKCPLHGVDVLAVTPLCFQQRLFFGGA